MTDGNYATPIGSAPVTANPTPYTAGLVCLAQYARANHVVAPRIAIGRIADYTGKEESDGSGRKVTQGASLLAMTAFAKAGMPHGRALRHLGVGVRAEIRQQQADLRQPQAERRRARPTTAASWRARCRGRTSTWPAASPS